MYLVSKYALAFSLEIQMISGERSGTGLCLEVIEVALFFAFSQLFVTPTDLSDGSKS